MSDQTPTDDTGRPGDPRQQDGGEDLLDSLLRAAKDDLPAADQADSDLAIADSSGNAELSFDEMFEKRVREAARQIETPEAPAAAPAEQEDNPLGVYAELDQTEASPVRATEEPRSSQASSGRGARRSRGRGAGPDREPVETTADAEAPASESEPEPTFIPEPAEGPADAVVEAMADDSMMSRSPADLELPVHQQEAAPRREVPSRVAEKDALSARQQGEAERLAEDIAAAGPMLAARYGPMRHIGLFQHHLDKPPASGTKVTLRTSRGVELGEVASPVCGDSCGESCGHSCVTPQRVAEFAVGNGPEYPLKREGKVLRVANVQDLADSRELEQVCRDAKRAGREMIQRLNLDMRIVTVEHLLGGERMVFYFASESRVDFRDLVKQLTAKYQIRVELRQVGSRDEARLVGDYERCGRQCCCQTFLKELKPVSMRMAKVQKATLDPSKISGRCGRLMCCLRYEDDGYQELRHALPKKNTWIRTGALVGRVLRTHILTQLVEVQLFDRSLAVVGVEDILETDVPEPTMSSQPDRPPRAPMRERSSATFLRDQTEPATPDKDDAAVADSSEAPGDGTKKRRRRRRKKKAPEGQGGGSPAASAAAAQRQGQPGAEGDGSRKKRRRRRRKPGSGSSAPKE